MTKQEKNKIEKAIAAYTQKATATASSAKDALTKSGIYTSDGILTPEYSTTVAD